LSFERGGGEWGGWGVGWSWRRCFFYGRMDNGFVVYSMKHRHICIYIWTTDISRILTAHTNTDNNLKNGINYCNYKCLCQTHRHWEHIIRRASVLYRHCCGALDYFCLQVNFRSLEVESWSRLRVYYLWSLSYVAHLVPIELVVHKILFGTIFCHWSCHILLGVYLIIEYHQKIIYQLWNGAFGFFIMCW
jgi:hypothetical protein